MLLHSISAVGVAIVGPLSWHDGWGKQTLYLMQALSDCYCVQYSCSRLPYPVHVDESILANLPVTIQEMLNQQNPKPTDVTLFNDVMQLHGRWLHRTMVPAAIKIAYSMIEQATLSLEHAQELNNSFDAIIVPDEWLIEVYKRAGVCKPLFVIPPLFGVEELLSKLPVYDRHTPFTFAVSATLCERKNIETLIKAFIRVFKDNPHVQLVIHASAGKKEYQRLQMLITSHNYQNVHILFKQLSEHEYCNFLQASDCYVLVSKGEGFSMTPRQALALGIPCILSNNTGHKTLCDEGLACPVECIQSGNYFECKEESLDQALRDMYQQYTFYKNKALQLRTRMQRYTQESLRPLYRMILSPSTLCRGDYNYVTPDYLMVTDESLFNKYDTLMKAKGT